MRERSLRDQALGEQAVDMYPSDDDELAQFLVLYAQVSQLTCAKEVRSLDNKRHGMRLEKRTVPGERKTSTALALSLPPSPHRERCRWPHGSGSGRTTASGGRRHTSGGRTPASGRSLRPHHGQPVRASVPSGRAQLVRTSNPEALHLTTAGYCHVGRWFTPTRQAERAARRFPPPYQRCRRC